MRMGIEPLPVPSDATKLISLHHRHQERAGNLPVSIERRDMYLRAFARWLEPVGLLEATRPEIELFLDGRRTHAGHKVSTRTRFYWIVHLPAFYKWALDEELTPVDPTAKIVRPKMRQVLPRPIDGDDLVMAVRAARPQMRAMLSLAALAGLRCGEIAGWGVMPAPEGDVGAKYEGFVA